MAVIRYNQIGVQLLARLMRAEVEGDGKLGMLMVGNTGVNRLHIDHFEFTKITNLKEMIFQSPGGFGAKQFIRSSSEGYKFLHVR
ncbi:hypothetical protein [Virgibacillus sp. L01]|uniref:hypothetical protein n=1 Tax=Virgibacillus sp. L01 TaxID=3457429 RepID=UPI003FCFD4CC